MSHSSTNDAPTHAVRATATSAWLDEAGTVYVPISKPDRGILKFNSLAASIWRSLLSEGITPEDWTKPDIRDFVRDLHAAGAISEPVSSAQRVLR